MAEPLYWIIAFKIHPGQEEAYRSLSGKLIEMTKEEPGTLSYEWSLSADGTIGHVYESYTDSTAIRAHAAHCGAEIGNLLGITDLLGLTIYGSVDEETRQALAPLKPVYMASIGGFTR